MREYIYGYNNEPLLPTGKWYINNRDLYIESFYYDEEEYIYFWSKTVRKTRWVHEYQIQEVITCERVL